MDALAASLGPNRTVYVELAVKDPIDPVNTLAGSVVPAPMTGCSSVRCCNAILAVPLGPNCTHLDASINRVMAAAPCSPVDSRVTMHRPVALAAMRSETVLRSPCVGVSIRGISRGINPPATYKDPPDTWPPRGILDCSDIPTADTNTFPSSRIELCTSFAVFYISMTVPFAGR